MKLNKKTKEIKSIYNIEDSIKKMEKLLEYESVKFISNSNSIESESIPFPMIGADRRNYSKKNFIGINPFTQISKIKIDFKKTELGETKLEVNVDFSRSLEFYILITPIFVLLCFLIPNIFIGASLCIVSLFFIFLYKFIICINYCLFNEIKNEVT